MMYESELVMFYLFFLRFAHDTLTNSTFKQELLSFMALHRSNSLNRLMLSSIEAMVDESSVKIEVVDYLMNAFETDRPTNAKNY